jgi:hypothetical protein
MIDLSFGRLADEPSKSGTGDEPGRGRHNGRNLQ